ncbi:MAG: hypothetical protein KAT53_09640 [Dehalococcoidia bacterium]|nr:hypothetical protein [Dehalococcoidia bacterium]
MAKSVKAEVWIAVRGQLVSKMAPQTIFLENETKGHLRDGRPVRFVKGKWVYILEN